MAGSGMSIIERLKGTTPRQCYQRSGFYVFRSVFPVGEVDKLAALARTMMPTYEGAHLRQSGHAEVNDFFPGTKLIRNPPFNLHLPLSSDLRPLSEALGALITSSALANRLSELDGAERYHINQTLLFFAVQTTGLHIDSWGLDTVPRGGAHTLWIPLQDIDFRSGVPAVIPWPVGKVVTEADLGLPSEGANHERYERYHQALSAKLLREGPGIVSALVRRGDVMIWSSLTPHFTMPSASFPAERLSLQVLLRPAHLKWGNFTVQPTDHSIDHVLPASDRFSFFVSEAIHRDFGIGELLPAGRYG
jgi:hypothetical protein